MVCFEHMRWGLKEAIEIMVSKHVACHRKIGKMFYIVQMG